MFTRLRTLNTEPSRPRFLISTRGVVVRLLAIVPFYARGSETDTASDRGEVMTIKRAEALRNSSKVFYVYLQKLKS
jgi:hypothetical protein